MRFSLYHKAGVPNPWAVACSDPGHANGRRANGRRANGRRVNTCSSICMGTRTSAGNSICASVEPSPLPSQPVHKAGKIGDPAIRYNFFKKQN